MVRYRNAGSVFGQLRRSDQSPIGRDVVDLCCVRNAAHDVVVRGLLGLDGLALLEDRTRSDAVVVGAVRRAGRRPGAVLRAALSSLHRVSSSTILQALDARCGTRATRNGGNADRQSSSIHSVGRRAARCRSLRIGSGGLRQCPEERSPQPTGALGRGSSRGNSKAARAGSRLDSADIGAGSAVQVWRCVTRTWQSSGGVG